MPTTTAAKPRTTSAGAAATMAQSLNASTQSRFASSQLIRNLGSGNDGVKFSFASGLRTAHGRD